MMAVDQPAVPPDGQAVPHGAVAAIGRGWEWVKAIAVVLWPIRYIIMINAAMIMIFCLPQAKDALYGAVIECDRPVFVFVAVMAWAAQTWYCGRFLYSLPLRNLPAPRYRQRPFNDAFAAPLKTWMPRALGALVFGIVGGFILGAGGWTPRVVAWTALYLLSGFVFLWATRARRRRLERVGRAPLALQIVHAAPSGLPRIFLAVWVVLLLLAAGSAEIDYGKELLRRPLAVLIVVMLGITSAALLLRLPELRMPQWRSTRRVVAVLIAVNVALFLLSIVAAAWAGAVLGPAVVLMASAGSWVGASSFLLAFPGERFRLPVTTFLWLATLVVIFAPKIVLSLFGDASGDYDNHRVRVLAPLPELADPHHDTRATLLTAFDAWRAQAPCLPAGDLNCRSPMVLVAAEGGASRSGYWVATVLGGIEDAVLGAAAVGRAKYPFHRSVFAISSVSGGSLGAAVYQRLVARLISRSKPLCRAGDGKRFAVCGQAVLQQDFLGPDSSACSMRTYCSDCCPATSCRTVPRRWKPHGNAPGTTMCGRQIFPMPSRSATRTRSRRQGIRQGRNGIEPIGCP
jgi:hypothetical protein